MKGLWDLGITRPPLKMASKHFLNQFNKCHFLFYIFSYHIKNCVHHLVKYKNNNNNNNNNKIIFIFVPLFKSLNLIIYFKSPNFELDMIIIQYHIIFLHKFKNLDSIEFIF